MYIYISSRSVYKQTKSFRLTVLASFSFNQVTEAFILLYTATLFITKLCAPFDKLARWIAVAHRLLFHYSNTLFTIIAYAQLSDNNELIEWMILCVLSINFKSFFCFVFFLWFFIRFPKWLNVCVTKHCSKFSLVILHKWFCNVHQILIANQFYRDRFMTM